MWLPPLSGERAQESALTMLLFPLPGITESEIHTEKGFSLSLGVGDPASVGDLAVGQSVLQGAIHFPPRGTPGLLTSPKVTKLLG